MRDLTPILMGDPGTHPRRNPTPEEIEKQETFLDWKRNNVRYSPIREWPVGELRTFPDFKSARSAQTSLYQKGLCGSLRKVGDGTYTVRRTV
jgi:hypothetical protein